MNCAIPIHAESAGEPARIWLWPNLLSLDAPVVAVVWQVMFARSFRVPIDPVAAVLLLLTVWLVYSADRTLDAWKGECRTPRHEFYRANWRHLLPVWVATLMGTAWLAIGHLSPDIFRDGAVLFTAVALYFAAVHFYRPVWAKEAVVGVLFALGASLVAWGRVRTMADAATILLFSGLCWMNCVAIQKWEGERLDWSLSNVALWLAGAAGVVLLAHRPLLGGAEMASAFAFIGLDRARAHLSSNAVRVLADVALLSPVLFLPVTR